MGGLQGWHLIILLIVILLLFGASRLPALAKSVGQSARVFKGEMKQLKDDEPNRAENVAEQPGAQTGPSAAPASGAQQETPLSPPPSGDNIQR